MSSIAPRCKDAARRDFASTLGVWIFLATELMFFGPLLFGYLYVRIHFPDSFAAASRHTDVALGTLNTAVLLTSSMTMAIAAAAHRVDARHLAARLLWVTAALGATFLVIKGVEYAHDWRAHLFPGPAFSFPGHGSEGAQLFFFLYFALTGLHALHLTIGIVLAGAFAFDLHRNRPAFANAQRTELAGLYWHFVDAIWIFLYPMLYLVGRAATGEPG
ncbi:MAG TPA: cytochrome c oxidase subunit 3 [Burkholderiaceae bacterium]|nr:cytochrome c oxidase subunit 3 [Burkholderiaceae bacterium]